MIATLSKKLKMMVKIFHQPEGEQTRVLQGRMRVQQILQMGKLAKLSDAGFCVTSQQMRVASFLG
jgi:hypothetical protein